MQVRKNNLSVLLRITPNFLGQIKIDLSQLCNQINELPCNLTVDFESQFILRAQHTPTTFFGGERINGFIPVCEFPDRHFSESNNLRLIILLHELIHAWKEDVARHVNSDIEPIRPERLCKELSDYLPSDAILVSDTGHAGIWTGTMLDFKYPEQMYVRCAGSLGWGLPAAMGAKCAQPDRPVICFTGDGGIWYHMTELDTAMKCGIHTVTVVNNNHSLNQEQGGVERTYGGRTAGSDELWLFPDADFAKMAESMGCFGIWVEKPGDIQSALEQAFASVRPAVVDVVTDQYNSEAPVPWAP